MDALPPELQVTILQKAGRGGLLAARLVSKCMRDIAHIASRGLTFFTAGAGRGGGWCQGWVVVRGARPEALQTLSTRFAAASGIEVMGCRALYLN
jgi:hypothetical protein